MDGGTLSNFPINLFHQRDSVPLLPTLGIQLSPDRAFATAINTPVDLLTAMNDSSRHILDREFLEENQDFQNLVAVRGRPKGSLRAGLRTRAR